jgi:hypothetical protein
MPDSANDQMREFLMSYDYDGESWMVGFAALSAGDAEKRIEARGQQRILSPCRSSIAARTDGPRVSLQLIPRT